MTVDKFRFTKDDSDYTTFPNEMLQQLYNVEALGLYAYFSSLPPTWEFHKEKIRSHFNIGRDKLEKLLNILLQYNLIQVFQERNLKGHFNHWRLHVNNPRSFKPLNVDNSPLTDFQETDRKPVNTTSAPFTDLPFTANQLLDNSSYKRNINKINKKLLENKQKSSLEKTEKSKSVDNSKRHEFADSMDKNAHEKKHLQEHDKRKAEEMKMKRTNGMVKL